jgi:hypothetical protein
MYGVKVGGTLLATYSTRAEALKKASEHRERQKRVPPRNRMTVRTVKLYPNPKPKPKKKKGRLGF